MNKCKINKRKIEKVGKTCFLFEKKKNEKTEINEKTNTEKMETHDEKRKKHEEIRIHTQNSRRFPGFTVVVVTFFVEVPYDFHDSVSECVSFQRKINNPFWCVSVLPKKSDNVH